MPTVTDMATLSAGCLVCIAAVVVVLRYRTGRQDDAVTLLLERHTASLPVTVVDAYVPELVAEPEPPCRPSWRERLFGAVPEGATETTVLPSVELLATDGTLTDTGYLQSRVVRPEVRVPTTAALAEDTHNALDKHWDDALAESRRRLDLLIVSFDDPHPVRYYRTALAADDTQTIDRDELARMLAGEQDDGPDEPDNDGSDDAQDMARDWAHAGEAL